MTVLFFFVFTSIAPKLSKTNSNIIQDIVRGVPVENAASNNDDTMPLPYCKAPINAAAEPTMSDGTASRAAALVHEAMIPFILKTTNTKHIIPMMPPHPVIADKKSPNPPMIAIVVAHNNRRSSE